MKEHAEGATLNREAFEYAKRLINEGMYLSSDRGKWEDLQPTTEMQNEFIQQHGYHEYGLWFLAIDYRHPEDTKERYKFPYGNFTNVIRSGCIAAEARAGQFKYFDIEEAARVLKEMIDNVEEQREVS